MSPRPFLVVLLAAFAAASCTAGSDSPTGPKPRAGAPEGMPECLDEERTVETAPLTGDVDGDAVQDEVSVVVDPRGTRGCLAFVVVRGNRMLAAPVDVLDESVLRLGLPAPNVLAEIDGAPGAEIVVNVHAGASTEFAALFTVRGSRLVQMTIGSAPDDLVAFGGSVAHLEGADCARGASLVVAGAVARGRRYVVTRTFLQAEGEALVVEGNERQTVSPGKLNSISELKGPPFGSCP